MELSLRLQTVANMAGSGNTVADIGCDHGYTSIYLVSNGLYSKAIAMDVRKGPLEIARGNVEKYDVSDKVDLRLSDGLDKLELGEADTAVIAGMGGPLVMKLLRRELDKAKQLKLVLQPQSELGLVRMYLWQQNFVIEEENMVYDEGKFYPMFVARYDENHLKEEWNIDQRELYFDYGKLLLESKNLVLKDYLQWEKGVNEELLETLVSRQVDKMRIIAIRRRLELNQMALKMME